MTSVQVLLSTFNGERHLPALLDSLVGQTHPHVSILARDDGSRDGLARIGTIGRDRDLRRRFVARALELEQVYGGQLAPADRRVVDRFVRGRESVLTALRYALRGEVYRQTTVDNLILKVLIALRHL